MTRSAALPLTVSDGEAFSLEALRANEAKYRFLSEAIPVQIWTSLPDGRLDYVSHQTAGYFGLTPAQLLADGWQNVVHPVDLPLAVRRWMHALETGEAYEVEFRLKSSDGAYHWHLGRAVPQRGPSGAIIRWFGTNTNIEDQRAQRRQVESLLSQLREQNELLALEAEVGAILTRVAVHANALQECAEAVTRRLDAAFTRIWTMSTDGSVLQLHASAGLYTPLDGPHARTPMDHLEIGRIAAERTPYRTNDVVGDLRVADQEWALREEMVAFAGYPILFGEKVIGVIAAFARHPLSEAAAATLASVANAVAQAIERQRSEAEEARSRRDADGAREMFQSLIMQAPAPICMLRGPEHTFAVANPGYMELVGASGTLVGLPVREALPELAGQGFYELLDRVFETGERCVGQDVAVAIDRGGPGGPEAGFMTFVYEAFRDLDGDIAGILVVAFDVTAAVRARESLQGMLDERDRLLVAAEDAREKADFASRAKDEFLATASHELRTPLNAILGWARLLRGNSLDASTIARGIETIERNAWAQVKLIDDILDGSRIITGKLHLEVVSSDLTKIVHAALDAVRPAAVGKEIVVTVDIDAAASRIQADPDRLQQVVWNLLNNSLKFTPKGGRIEVRVAREGTSIELSVKDNGLGITPEFLPHVFDRFRQADGSTTRRSGGLGLGLALVRHLAEAHGGSVRAESPGVGLGATFVVTLPVQAVFPESFESIRPTRDDESARRTLPPNSLQGARVLVLDNEADAREMVTTLLRTHGAEVSAAACAEEALAMLDARAPHVIVSDVGMPITDGYAFMSRVRALPSPAARVPAIALTAYAREQDRRSALEAGFQRYLAKPADPEALVRLVGDLVHPGGDEPRQNAAVPKATGVSR